MKDDLTFIAVVLDRSGSMATVRADTIGGFNTFLTEQQKVPGEVLFTLAQFSSSRDPSNGYQILADAVPIARVEPLSEATYTPSGGTALLDAIGRTIDSVGARLAALPESERPSRVLLMIQTDGEENESRFYSRARIAEMIKRQREIYNWDFVFIGASEASLAQAETYGFATMDAHQYSATPAGTNEVMRKLSFDTTKYRAASAKGPKRGFFAP